MEEALLAGKGGGGGGDGSPPTTVAAEAVRQLRLAAPLAVGYMLQNVIMTISSMIVGHLGELALSGASLATSLARVTGFSIMLGLSTALDTLCGQAHGAGKHHLLGVYMQTAMLAAAAASAPIAALLFYAGELLLLFGQDASIAAEASTYARWSIPAVFAYGLLQCYARFLQAQGVVVPVMAAAAATVACHVPVCWVMVHGLGMGSRGAAIANGLSYSLNVTVLAVYVRVAPSCKKSWTGFTTEALGDMVGFLRLAIPSALMVCLEWWSYEILVLLSGLLPNPKLETSILSITINTAALVYTVAFGLGAAVSTRVSNELGAGHPAAARLAMRVVVLLVVPEGLAMGLILVLARYTWGNAYSSEEEVVTYVVRMMPILAVSNFLDGVQCVLGGAVRGCGWQKVGACMNLGAFYVVGVPVAFVVGFVLHLGGMGLWLGIISGVSVQLVLMAAITLRMDWEKEEMMAKERISSSSVTT